jgi:hypothetical protein
MKAAEDETRLRETGRKIFAGEADFKWASTAIDNLPRLPGGRMSANPRL